MDSVIQKLADIETTAEAIVEHAQEQKSEIEKRIQAKRDQFDKKLEEDTQKKLLEIRTAAEEQMNQVLEEQREKNRSTIDALKEEFQEYHSKYAREILNQITEV